MTLEYLLVIFVAVRMGFRIFLWSHYILQGKIIIGNNVWIGANCVILKDVNIGDGAVIGAGTIVTHNVEMNEVIVGNKQTRIKTRFE